MGELLSTDDVIDLINILINEIRHNGKKIKALGGNSILEDIEKIDLCNKD